jgi:FkbM family methyltransferase
MISKKYYLSLKESYAVWLIWLLIRCVLKLGFVKGWQVFLKLVSRNSKPALIEIELPGYSDRIYARSNTSDTSVFETVFISSRFDINDTRTTPKLIIDAGANVGYVSIFFAHKYPSANIYAIEPESSNYEVLVRNTAAYKNIKPIRAALWKDNSPLFIQNSGDDKWAFRVSGIKSKRQDYVNSLVVNDILDLDKSTFIDIFKIDIEGSEKELFTENYASWIDKVGLFIIEFHDGFRSGCKDTFYSAIEALKHKEYIKGENHFIFLE